MRVVTLAAAGIGLLLAGEQAARAQGTLNVYCSAQIEWCQALATGFQATSGVRVNMTQKGSGEALAQIRAEAQNPRGDIWFGGTGDPHLSAAEEGLSQPYQSPLLPQLQDWAQKQAAASGYKTVGVYAGVLGFGYNTEITAKKGITPPRCWADLTGPAFNGEVQMANPNSSGTAYVMIATLVQLMGEDKAFEYLKALHPSINSYARSGTGPIKAVARGETAASISFMHDAVTERVAGFPVGTNAPCEGTGYEVGSMSILKGARNLANAKKFADWALSVEGQATGAATKQFQTPANTAAPLPDGAPRFADMKFIDYDFAKYGAAAERKRLIERWDREIGSLPR